MSVLRRIVVLAWMCGLVSAAWADKDIGIILMHGKEGRPAAPNMVRLAKVLRDAGYLVSTPEMPWSHDRIYDATVDQAMSEIDREADALRKGGAKRIVVAGHSQGANAAIRYAATRSVDGLIALAPGHSPEFLAKQLSGDLARARQMIAQGKGDERGEFKDVNVGHDLTVTTTAAIYFSWLDPEGSAVMPLNAVDIKSPLPIFMAVGSHDPVTRPQSYIFDKAPAHTKSRYITVNADHIGVPDAASAELVTWLDTL
ncbi:MAG TPA: hypothetical protein VFW00_01840 [Rhodocyclaceae bacterium]|nr:hypothetical protein [Rhodocyclaceae bacterium]